MIISPVNQNLFFASKRKDVKLADDIQRKTKLEFPLLSYSYAQYKYGILKEKEGKEVSSRAKQIGHMLNKTILINRDKVSKKVLYRPSDKSFDKTLPIWLQYIKEAKIGNCQEMAMATLAALYANNYLNSTVARLCLKSVFKDKLTNKILHSDYIELDHAFVLTDMKKGNNEYNYRNIVIDPWLSFASTREEANGRYKEMFSKDFLKEQEEALMKRFEYKFEKIQKFNKDNCVQISSFYFKPMDDYSKRGSKENLSAFLKSNFPNLVVKN